MSKTTTTNDAFNHRALAFFTWDLANKSKQENPFSLVGGFIILRFINPVLLTPEIYDIVPRSGEGALSMKARRNLTFLTKLLQVPLLLLPHNRIESNRIESNRIESDLLFF